MRTMKARFLSFVAVWLPVLADAICPRPIPFSSKNPAILGSLNIRDRYPLCGSPDHSTTTVDVNTLLKSAKQKTTPLKKKPLVINITPSFQGIVWKGWGTTLSRMGAFLGSLDPDSMHCMARRLFHPTQGLNLNILRYGIPGGQNPKLPIPSFADRGYRPQPNAAYNWSADPYQTRFLKLAKSMGVRIFEAVSYSPPWWMTTSGDTTGSTSLSKSNLAKGHVNDFAAYLADVVEHFSKHHGIAFDAIAPFNEPLEGWWVKSATRETEGCSYSASNVNYFLPILQQELSKRSLPTKIAGVDSWVRTTAKALEGSFTPGTIQLLDRLDVHGYRKAPDMSPKTDAAAMLNFRQLAAKYKKPVWQTEWGPLGVVSASEIDVGLLLARKIMQHVNLIGVEAWFHWSVVQPLNPFWGLLRLNWVKPLQAPRLTKQFYTFLHFTQFVVRGTQILNVPQECAHTVLAAYDPHWYRLTVTMVNQRKAPVNAFLHITGFRCRPRPELKTPKPAQAYCTLDHYRTTAAASFRRIQHLGRYALPGSTWKAVLLEPESLHTIVIGNIVK